jgi:biotin transport system substrate-specific component
LSAGDLLRYELRSPAATPTSQVIAPVSRTVAALDLSTQREEQRLSASAPSIRRVPILADALPGARSRDVLLMIAGAGLTALCAQITVHVPPSPVPITGQTFAVVLAGAALGSLRGGASQLLYLLLGLALPIYAGGAHGWTIISGPTGGYLVAFPIDAFVIGRLAERGRDRQLLTAFTAYVAGQLIIFGIACPGSRPRPI